jgi:hypothetical protein
MNLQEFNITNQVQIKGQVISDENLMSKIFKKKQPKYFEEFLPYHLKVVESKI